MYHDEETMRPGKVVPYQVTLVRVRVRVRVRGALPGHAG